MRVVRGTGETGGEAERAFIDGSGGRFCDDGRDRGSNMGMECKV